LLFTLSESSSKFYGSWEISIDFHHPFSSHDPVFWSSSSNDLIEAVKLKRFVEEAVKLG
jgi:hypothetical protein